ncbi:VOC family protein [Actinopolymorpha rutila]|uniref:Putative glyoxalase superfamily protein PhnB n=1 Tax=Actinopolymorpha rutila TaxID=446787 RepID=A0A852ZSI8_9ACTN|nr:VOC family protein [Actinopolymorpha rutila]NYH91960.1 putative glyoxalase superfamily protein PhnB [Actinopolymorpha rutila]
MTYQNLLPRLIVSDANAAIDFYRKAFGAEEVARFADDDGKVVHAELRFGPVAITLKDEDPGTPDMGPAALDGSPVILTLYVSDADAVSAQLVGAGATVVFPVGDSPYGRMGRLRDPFGHVWMLHQDAPDFAG